MLLIDISSTGVVKGLGHERVQRCLRLKHMVCPLQYLISSLKYNLREWGGIRERACVYVCVCARARTQEREREREARCVSKHAQQMHAAHTHTPAQLIRLLGHRTLRRQLSAREGHVSVCRPCDTSICRPCDTLSSSSKQWCSYSKQWCTHSRQQRSYSKQQSWYSKQ